MTTETTIEAMLNGDNFFTCQLKGGCRMEKAACVIRRRNAITGWVAGSSSSPNKPGAQDTGCRDCAQGEQIASEVSPGAVKAYQMRVGGNRKWDKKAMAKPGQILEPSPEPIGKVCSRKECKHGCKPQPLDNFHKGSGSGGKNGYCKDCQREMAEIRKDKLAGAKASLRERLDRAAGIAQEQHAHAAESKPTKVCHDSGCEAKGAPQPLGNFHNNKATADGKAAYCKPCVLKRQRDYDQKRRETVKPNNGAADQKRRDFLVVASEPLIPEELCVVGTKPYKLCNTCGAVKKVDDFAASNTSKDGRMHICRECFKGRQESGLRRENRVTVLHLNFEGHPELLANLSKAAQVEFRTVQAQAMFIIERALAPRG